jgi:hypothetical protein
MLPPTIRPASLIPQVPHLQVPEKQFFLFCLQLPVFEGRRKLFTMSQEKLL